MLSDVIEETEFRELENVDIPRRDGKVAERCPTKVFSTFKLRYAWDDCSYQIKPSIRIEIFYA